MTINDPTALLNFNLLQGRYLASGYYLSYTEYIFSLTYLLIMAIAFLISLFGMWEKRRQIIWPYLTGISALLAAELVINVAHQRYFLPFLPSLYLGLFLFKFFPKKYSNF